MKIGIIGCGNMSTAIAAGAIKSGVIQGSDILVLNSNAESSANAASAINAVAAKSLQELITSSDTVILGVKPFLIADILQQINALAIDLSDKLFISIAAGISLAKMETELPANTKIIRTMPNTPTLVGEGVIAYTLSAACSEQDKGTIETLLQSSATLSEIKENLMDAVTGLSGSGPAYVYTFIEALADGAVKEGLTRPLALALAAKTVLGGAKMVIDSGTHPAILRDQVASPGGTTIAAIAALEENGFRNATINAVSASASRSKELS